MHPVPSECPVCHGDLLVARMVCPSCGTLIENQFEMDRLSRLIPEQRHFVEVFLLCEGKLNCIQEELGISYPTVRSRLDEIIRALKRRMAPQAGPVLRPEPPLPPPPPAPPEPPLPQEARDEILARLARREITAAEALALLEA